MGPNDYVECENCGFVVVSDGSLQMTPKHWDSCPDCDGIDFETVQH